VFLLPGVDRSAMKSLWTPATRWSAVTEEGLDGGPVIPADYDGSSRGIATVKANVDRSGEIVSTGGGRLAIERAVHTVAGEQ